MFNADFFQSVTKVGCFETFTFVLAVGFNNNKIAKTVGKICALRFDEKEYLEPFVNQLINKRYLIACKQH